MKTNLFTQNTIWMIGLGCILMISCKRINTDPIKGADEFCEMMVKCVDANDYGKASQLMNEYWEAYPNDNRIAFFLALRANFMIPDNQKIANFIISADKTTYPIFRKYMEYIIVVSQSDDLQRQQHSNGSAVSADLIKTLHEYNEQTPRQMSNTVCMEKANFDFDNRMFQFNYTEVWPENADAKYALERLNQMRISTLQDQLEYDPQGTNRAFLEELVRNKYGIRVQYVGVPNNDTIKSEVSYEEIKELLQSY